MLRARSHGFTLLELIVVIGIFAIFAAMAYGGLDTVLKTRVRVEEGLTRTENYDRAYLRLRTDFQNAASRPIRSADGGFLPAFTFDTYTKSVELTRGGWQNLLSLPRATLERVSYLLDDSQPEGAKARNRLEDKRLVRRSWYVLDRAPQTRPQDLILIEHVEDLNWRFLDESRTWQDSWPPNGNNATSTSPSGASAAAQVSPMAIEISLRTKDWGDMKFLFRLGADGAANVAKLLSAPLAPPGGSTGSTTGNTSGNTTGSTSGGTTGASGGGSGGNDGGNDGGKPEPP